MQPKYSKGQKVKILEIKNQTGAVKYPELTDFTGQTGTIIIPRDLGIAKATGIQYVEPGFLQFLYQVQLDNTKTKLYVYEEALTPI